MQKGQNVEIRFLLHYVADYYHLHKCYLELPNSPESGSQVIIRDRGKVKGRSVVYGLPKCQGPGRQNFNFSIRTFLVVMNVIAKSLLPMKCQKCTF